MADLPSSLRTLLDYARAEAKRAGHARTEPIHLAAALLRADADFFLKSFGPDAKDVLQRRLLDVARSSADRSDAPETLSLLEKAAATTDPRAAVVQALLGLGLFAAGTNASAPGASAGTGTMPNTAATGSTSFTIPSGIGRFVAAVAPDGQVAGRDAIVDQLIGLLARRKPVTPCVLAARGSGKSALFRALAARLGDPAYRGPLAGTPVVRVRAETIVGADRANALRRVIQELGPQPILVLDDIEVLAALGGTGADLDMLGVIRSVVGQPERRAVLTIAAPYFNKLEVHDGELASTLTRIELPALDDGTLRKIGEQRVTSLAQFHRVDIPQDVFEAALAPPTPGSKRIHPGLLIDRLDYAGACAALRPERRATVADLGITATAVKKRVLDATTLAKALEQRVTGQPDAIERVARRLSLTSADLDLRPAHPDGVFLFVGPSGVGKTELALAMCEAIYGDEEAMIRLDMSEYAQETAIGRLTGADPMYVGHTDPESWLTTKVRGRPYSLVLLDEFEKAHPRVWNTFLQVFDAGRLTDGRGNTAHFSDCIIVLTSNIGSRSFASPPMGFHKDKQEQAHMESARVVEEVRRMMPPELANRIDNIIVFRPLDSDVIYRIAEKQIMQAFERRRAKGYDLTISPEAVQLIASGGYDPAFGARHVMRNIEETLLASLVGQPPGRLRAEVRDRKIVWRQVQ